jgi:hypothetical protein
MLFFRVKILSFNKILNYRYIPGRRLPLAALREAEYKNFALQEYEKQNFNI